MFSVKSMLMAYGYCGDGSTVKNSPFADTPTSINVEMPKTKPELELILKSAAEGDFHSMAIIYTHEVDAGMASFPDELFPENFRVCCIQIQPESRTFDPERRTRDGRTEQIFSLPAALMAMRILGSSRMEENIIHAHCVPIITKYWPKLFLGLKAVYILLGGEEPGSRADSMLSSLVSGVIASIFRNGAIRRQLMVDIELQKFIWTLWLAGGPPTYENKSVRYSSAASAVAYMSLDPEIKHSPLFPICMAVCEQYGGKDAVAEIALLSVFNTMMSEDRWVIVDGLPQHVGVLMVFDTHDPFKQVARKIYELDGIPKLVQGLTTMVEDFRDLVVGDFFSGIVGTLILIVEKIGTETYKRVEQLVRSGVLQLLFALNPRQGDLPDAIIGKCDRLIRNLPQFFVYNSVVESFTEQMRWATTGENPPETCVSEGPLAPAWSYMKSVFVDRYYTKRLFETLVESSVKYCNNCARAEESRKFSCCPHCAQMVYYCSKNCQSEDWKAGSHRETCGKESSGIFNNDIPFLYFLANKYVAPRSKQLLEDTSVPLEVAIFCLYLAQMDNHGTVHISSTDLAFTLLRTISRATSTSHRIIDRRSQYPVKAGEPITFIQIYACEGWERMVVRYIPLDPKSDFLDPENVKADIARIIMEYLNADFPDPQQWNCVGIDGENVHIFDRIDDYVRVNHSDDTSD